MKHFMLSIFLAGSFCRLGAEQTQPVWQTDLAPALAQAGQEHRLVLVNFTGSDWCVWCHRLRDEVFTKEHFLSYAHDQLVLVELDFPREIKQPPALAEKNAQWAKKYSVTGYPTILVLNATGDELGRISYMEGGAKTFVRELKRIALKAGPVAGKN